MLAKKCDRCGVLYEMYNVPDNKNKINGLMTLNIDYQNSYFKHGPYDLCPACSKELTEWLNGAKGENDES